MSPLPQGVDSDLDAFQKLIREVQSHEAPQDRRGSPRFGFSARQRIAPLDDMDTPTGQLSFTTVRCHDLSTSGLSLILPGLPTFKHAVLELKTPADPIYVVVEVVRSESAPGIPGHHLVGCRFVKKVAL